MFHSNYIFSMAMNNFNLQCMCATVPWSIVSLHFVCALNLKDNKNITTFEGKKIIVIGLFSTIRNSRSLVGFTYQLSHYVSYSILKMELIFVLRIIVPEICILLYLKFLTTKVPASLILLKSYMLSHVYKTKILMYHSPF